MDMKSRKTVVTGGAGFIGSHLVDALIDKGYHVTVIDNLTSGHLSNLSHIKKGLSFLKDDIRDYNSLKRAVKGCDIIFHQAAVVSVPKTVEDPLESAMVNDIGTLNVMEAARQENVRRVVLASSCAVYGDNPESPKKEAMRPNLLSPYALQKFTTELQAELYTNLYGLETVALRYFNVYGPRQDPSSVYSGVISIFMNKAIKNESPIIYGDGNQSRDFIFVKDVVAANILAAQSDSAKGEVLNIGTSNNVSVNKLWEMIKEVACSKGTPKYEPPRAGDILESLSNIDKARSKIGFEPSYSLKNGLEATFEWYKKS